MFCCYSVYTVCTIYIYIYICFLSIPCSSQYFELYPTSAREHTLSHSLFDTLRKLPMPVCFLQTAAIQTIESLEEWREDPNGRKETLTSALAHRLWPEQLQGLIHPDIPVNTTAQRTPHPADMLPCYTNRHHLFWKIFEYENFAFESNDSGIIRFDRLIDRVCGCFNLEEQNAVPVNHF